MKVIVDSCIWSEFLRRQTTQNQATVKKMTDLVKELRIVIIGAIRQEVLSGIKHEDQFNKLRQKLSYFPNFVLHENDYELAAQLYNQLRSKGIQGSNTDFLICAVAINHGFAIFADDKDFDLFAQHVSLERYL